MISSVPKRSADGFGAALTPWRAVPVAAWPALKTTSELRAARDPILAEDFKLL